MPNRVETGPRTPCGKIQCREHGPPWRTSGMQHGHRIGPASDDPIIYDLHILAGKWPLTVCCTYKREWPRPANLGASRKHDPIESCNGPLPVDGLGRYGTEPNVSRFAYAEQERRFFGGGID